MATRKRANNSFYSYSAKRTLRQEEVSAYRRITFATILVIALIVGGYFLGVPLLANLGNGASDDQITPLGSTDSIAPAAPQISSLPDQIRTKTLNISGSAESGSTVTVLVNDEEAFSTLADKEGLFSGGASLGGGENLIVATAKDAAGNESRKSKQLSITYDATPPSLVLLQELPSQTAEQTITVSGKAEANAKVTINQRVAVVNGDGVFNHTMQLNSGENKIEIVASDAAENTRRIERSVTYTGGQQSTSSANQN